MITLGSSEKNTTWLFNQRDRERELTLPVMLTSWLVLVSVSPHAAAAEIDLYIPAPTDYGFSSSVRGDQCGPATFPEFSKFISNRSGIFNPEF